MVTGALEIEIHSQNCVHVDFVTWTEKFEMGFGSELIDVLAEDEQF